MKYLVQLGGLGIALDFVKISAHKKSLFKRNWEILFPLIGCFLFQQLDDRHVKF